ncbi:MAG: hypothetical protein AAGG57_07035 [Pseudomonadota bacterium]
MISLAKSLTKASLNVTDINYNAAGAAELGEHQTTVAAMKSWSI